MLGEVKWYAWTLLEKYLWDKKATSTVSQIPFCFKWASYLHPGNKLQMFNNGWDIWSHESDATIILLRIELHLPSNSCIKDLTPNAVLPDLIPGESLLPGLTVAPISLCVYMTSSLMCIQRALWWLFLLLKEQ